MEQVDPDIKEYILKTVKEQYVERGDNPLYVLPHFVSPSKFYVDEYNKYKAELERLKNLTDEESKEEEIAYRKRQLCDYKKYFADEKDKLKNLIMLLEKVRDWNCPESLLELKNYIMENINYDIISRERHLKHDSLVDAEISGKEFKEEMMRRYENIVNNCLKSIENERVWVNQTNKMLEDLKKNLGDW